MLESAEVAGQVADGEAAAPAQQLRESLARTEEELINQRQQNEYLEERIRELESRLQEAEEKAVEDADLANMEDRLRVQREAAADDSGGAWYSRPMTWLAAVVVLAAGLLGWWFSRRGRAAEFEQRLAGASYEDIARAGGGILSTVTATRAAARERLLERKQHTGPITGATEPVLLGQVYPRRET